MLTTLLSSHTAKSLLAELIAGRAVITSTGREFRLSSEAARRALAWYSGRSAKWDKNVQKDDIDSIVNAAIANVPFASPQVPPEAAKPIRHLHISSVRAHRFAGLHAYHSDLNEPDDFYLELDKPLISIQGRNGTGKTSLINAITWCLTGYVHRPQRQPETTGIPLEIEQSGEDAHPAHISVISPVPPPEALGSSTDRDRVPIDTWVELTVVDHEAMVVGIIRRRVSRSIRGKITEEFNDGSIGIDPIAYEIGSRMPGLIPYIQLGAKSDFGVGVSMLTGLRPLQQLAQHAVKTRARIRGDFAKGRRQSIDAKTATWQQRTSAFHQFMADQSELIRLDAPAELNTRMGIAAAQASLEKQQTEILAAASVLGPACDLTLAKTRQNLLRSVEPAIEAISFKKLRTLASAAVIVDLHKLSDDDVRAAEAVLSEIATDAMTLASVHEDPPLAARLRLYARVAGWLRDEKKSLTDDCPVCGSSLAAAVDPRSGQAVTQHLRECFDKDADALQKTVMSWELASVQRLRTDLPEGLLKHLDASIAETPHEMLNKALTEELFAEDCFKGALSNLKALTTEICRREIGSLPRYVVHASPQYPRSLGPLNKLTPLATKAAKLITFAHWRRLHDGPWRSVFASTIGTVKNESTGTVSTSTLASCLLALRKQVETAEPLTRALEMLAQLDETATEIEKDTQRLGDYEAAAKALDDLAALNEVVADEIDALVDALMNRAKEWKQWLYRSATATAPRLATADVSDSGAMSMSVDLNGTIAPAHAVANASDLRASLVGFLFAFWEHIWTTRGGLSLLLLDDVQELFDRDNRRRVAAAIPKLVKQGARVICTSNDLQFARELAFAAIPVLTNAQFTRHLLHAVSSTRRCAALGVFEDDVDEKRRKFERTENENLDASAVPYLCDVRTHVEQRLLDLFDDVIGVPLLPKPTLSPLRDEARSRIAKGVEPFVLSAIRRFVEDPALQQGSPVLDLLNRSHHAGREAITFGDVHAIRDDLNRLTEVAEAASDAYQRWLRRDQPMQSGPVLVGMPRPIIVESLDVPFLWELAAFTSDLESFGHPVTDGGRLTSAWFTNKAMYRVTSTAFGFACPPGSLAIVDLVASEIDDSRLVIALRGKSIFTRRFLRNDADPSYVALGSEEPNPLKRAPSLFVRTDQVRLLKVVGVLFDQPRILAKGTPEAYEDNASMLIAAIESVFRVEGESALPLALPGQVVLAGALIDTHQLPTMKDVIVAVETTAGGLLKRVAGTDMDDGTILLDAIGGLGGSVLARIGSPSAPSPLPKIKKCRRVVGILYDV
jgi:AAA domain-containing protein